MTSTSHILDAAEEIFGTRGFEGGNLRRIAAVAGVSQALLHYHYSNKEALYQAVFERRADAIRVARQERLALAQSSPAGASLEEVLEILFLPLDSLLNERRGNLRFYVQMLAEVTIRGDERSVAIMKGLYDPTARIFVDAFMKSVPNLQHEDAVWAYLFATGARMQVHSPAERAQRLGRGARYLPPAGYKLLLPFVADGIRGMAARQGVNADVDAQPAVG